ncbi:MAG: hypothetical protein IPI28_17925 [Candidatus Omnitrophica bacterium]|nr:hypothetical protein [Candidatus Omnitrophota bacterium]
MSPAGRPGGRYSVLQGKLFFSEIIYLAAFFGLALIRSFNPEIEGMWKGGGSEKFMDLNFVNSILSSSQFPPNDNWLAGYPINYYYYGYYMAALLTRVTGVLPHVGYNLMVVTVYALAIQGLVGVAAEPRLPLVFGTGRSLFRFLRHQSQSPLDRTVSTKGR